MPHFKNIGIPELIIILVLAILIFGPSRIGKLGAELGKGIRGFREGMGSKDKDKDEEPLANPEGESSGEVAPAEKKSETSDTSGS